MISSNGIVKQPGLFINPYRSLRDIKGYICIAEDSKSKVMDENTEEETIPCLILCIDILLQKMF